MRSVFPVLLVFALAPCARADVSLITNGRFEEGMSGWKVSKDDRYKIVSVEGQPFAKAIAFTVQDRDEPKWSVQLRQVLNQDLELGQSFVFRAMMRSDAPLEPVVALQSTTPPVQTLWGTKVPVGADWQEVRLEGTTRAAAMADGYQLVFNLAVGGGTIEIADISLELPGVTATQPQAETADKPTAPVALSGENILHNPAFEDGLAEWTVRDAAGTVTVEPVEGQPFAQAAKAQITDAAAKPWDVQLRQPLDQAIAAGQAIEIRAMLRSPEGVPVQVSVQQVGPPHQGAVFTRWTPGPQWQSFQLSGASKLGADADASQIVFNLANGKGTVEVADIQVRLGDVGVAQARWQKPAGPLPKADFSGLSEAERGKIPGLDHDSIVGGLDSYKLMGAANGNMKVVDAGDDSDRQALRIETTQATDHAYNIQAASPILDGVQKGDTLLAVFSFRSSKVNALAGYATTEFAFERKGGTYLKSVAWGTSGGANQDWQTMAVPFTAAESYGPGEAQIVFRAGYGQQAIDVAGVSVVNLGSGVSLVDLPATPRTYQGQEPDATWRAAAAARIEKYRKGDVRVTVVDAQGNPVPDTAVEYDIIRHAFGFGSAINLNEMPGGKNAKTNGPYAETLEKLFNQAVFENAMKWRFAQKPWAFKAIERNMKWLEKRGIRVRGHNAVWPSWKRSPAGLQQQFANDPEGLRQAVDDRVRDVVTRYAGQISSWDVVNEPYINNDFMKILGDEAMADWFKIAAEADPGALLFLNDNQIISDPSPAKLRLNYYLTLIDKLRQQGARVDGLGVQAHFGWNLTGIDDILQSLDRIADKNVRIEVTEFDMAIDDEQLQAQYTRDFMTAVFSHPNVDGFMVWGFWEGCHWRPNAAMYRKDWSRRPWGDVYEDLVFHQWTTEGEARTDAGGAFSLRGFYGTYKVKAVVNDTPLSGEFTLAKNKGQVRVQLAPS